jgi:hypothetical protein
MLFVLIDAGSRRYRMISLAFAKWRDIYLRQPLLVHLQEQFERMATRALQRRILLAWREEVIKRSTGIYRPWKPCIACSRFVLSHVAELSGLCSLDRHELSLPCDITSR